MSKINAPRRRFIVNPDHGAYQAYASRELILRAIAVSCPPQSSSPENPEPKCRLGIRPVHTRLLALTSGADFNLFGSDDKDARIPLLANGLRSRVDGYVLTKISTPSVVFRGLSEPETPHRAAADAYV